MHFPTIQAVPGEVAHRLEARLGDGPLDGRSDLGHGASGLREGDRRRERVRGGLDEVRVAAIAREVDRAGGVRDPTVHVDSHVHLHDVPLLVDGLVVGRGAVVSGALVPGGLRREGRSGAALSDHRLDRLEDGPELHPWLDGFPGPLTAASRDLPCGACLFQSFGVHDGDGSADRSSSGRATADRSAGGCRARNGTGPPRPPETTMNTALRVTAIALGITSWAALLAA